MTPEWFFDVCQYALADTETLQATYDIARMLIDRKVDGDFVECGVFAGAQVAMMARAIQDAGATWKRVHLFDSFEGIPVAGPLDHELQGKPPGISACSLEQVQKNMKRWGIPGELLAYHAGWLEDTAPVSSIKKISFLRLDADLHSATKVCMEHLYPKVVRGGWVCVDDFNLSGCRQAVLDKCIPAPVYWRIPTK